MMPEDNSTKTYHPLAKSMLWTASAFALMSLYICVMICLLVSIPWLLLRQDFMREDFPALLFVSVVFFCVAVLAAGTLWIWYAVDVIGRFFRTLKVSPSGLEYRHPGLFNLQCTWEDVKGLGLIRGPYWHRTFLNLKDAQLSGLGFLAKLEGVRLWRPLWPRGKYAIQLSGLEGWPEGGLADDLRRYAPHVFKDGAAANGL